MVGAMRSRWNDAEAATLDGLDLLVYASRLIGAETSLVVWGGGNTSIKTAERDHRGRDVGVLRVKGSGSDLKSVQRKDFPGVRMDDIRALLDRQDMGDQEMVAYLAHGLMDPGGVRPSIETLLHGFVDAQAVVHTHADAIVSLTNNDRPREVLAGVYGKDVIALDYRRPGFRISREVADAIAAEPQAHALVLERHGTICWGATIREAYESTIELITRAEDAVAERRKGRRVFGGPRVDVLAPAARRAAALAVAPRLRGRLGKSKRVVLGFDDSPKVAEFASSMDAPALSQVGPATPDHTIYTKRLPCFVDLPRSTDDVMAVWNAVDRSVDRFVADYTAYFEAHKFPGAELLDPLPRVVLVPGLGMFTAGRDRRTAGIVNDIYHHTIDVLGNASAFGRYVSLTAKDAFDVEYWPLELYKLTLAPPEKELARRIALITGGGSGIGRAVARRLATEGAHVVVGDLDEAGARTTAEEITTAVGGRALGLRMDVTSEASVRAAFEETVLAYGGLDILVSNAGMAHSSPVARMALGDWERSFAVNATGHFLVAREAMRILMAQGLGGALVFVATKNVMSPGKDFAAYSAAKAAEAQLAKVLALEGAPHGIRSNIVNPDAVFQDSKLWSEDVRRERAAAQGIAVDQLEDFYRKRNLLGARILPEDVAEAVLFLAADRSAKTTGCTLTVDGGVKDAFPR
jgi:rhamnulose-1-phosphate aldolase/alcohol dehydrogenase